MRRPLQVRAAWMTRRGTGKESGRDNSWAEREFIRLHNHSSRSGVSIFHNFQLVSILGNQFSSVVLSRGSNFVLNSPKGPFGLSCSP